MQQHVLGFKVAVDNGLRMKQRNRRTDLTHHYADLKLGDRCGLLDVFAEVAIERAFLNDVEVQKVVEEAIDLDDIGVADENLYLDLPKKLIEHAILSELAFGHDLDGAEHAALLLGC